MKRAIVVAVLVIAAFAVSDAVVAARTGRPQPAGPQVRFMSCTLDPVTHQAVAGGTVEGATRAYAFTVTFTDDAGEEEVAPVSAAGPFAVRSHAAFPGRRIRCAVAPTGGDIGM